MDFKGHELQTVENEAHREILEGLVQSARDALTRDDLNEYSEQFDKLMSAYRRSKAGKIDILGK